MVEAQNVLLNAGRPTGEGVGRGVVGSPETCATVLNQMSDDGYDEALLFMQMFRTPHEKIMESIELFAKKVKPLLKEKESAPLPATKI
jgi:alkanesulfonate monooxygenase SsuD/methylene tetrahydromethanopterin reductase-like flavin-dependent oxidoreductase (luciferase family)